MSTDRVLRLLEDVANGSVDPRQAFDRLGWMPSESVGVHDGDVDYARLDHHRALRVGFPEVVFCEGKTTDQVVAICQRLGAGGAGFLATRADDAKRAALAAAFPAASSAPVSS